MTTLSRLICATVLLGVLPACRDARIVPITPAAFPLESAVGLDLRFVNGTSEPITVLSGRRYSIDSIALLATATGTPDTVLETLATATEFSSLDWSDLEFDQEQIFEEFDFSLRIERYYRRAAWMGGEHRFDVRVLDASGNALGSTIELRTGPEWPPLPDEAFATRRFGVVTRSDIVPEDGDLTDIEFAAVAAVQLRNGIRGFRTFLIPEEAAELEITWDHRPIQPYHVPLNPVSSANWDYGLEIVTTVLPPAGGSSTHIPGDTIEVMVDLFDRVGVPLHESGSFPSHQEFIAGLVTSGIEYTKHEPSAVYYLDTNRERNLIASLTGPIESVRQTHSEVPRTEFALDKVQEIATFAADGFLSLHQSRPAAPDLYGDEAPSALPLSNVFAFELPLDTPGGTYRFTIKVHRHYFGEETIATAVTEITVDGFPAGPPVVPLTGNCEHCHQGNFALSSMLHYVGNTATCTGCHIPYAHQTNTSLPYQIHRIHSQSDRYEEDPRDCTVCHLQPTIEVEDNARWLVCTGCHLPQETHDGFHPFGDVESCADVKCHHTVNPEPHILVGQ